MQFLERISRTPRASWYALRGDHDGPVRRYVVSTPEGREVCNRPELLGVRYTRMLRDAVASALATAPFRPLLENHPEDRVCVVHFLRGGLNFGLRGALAEAYGFNRHSAAFMSSQRARVDGRWTVREDMYRKLRIPRDAVLVLGDVVATGVTLDNGLRVLADEVAAQGSSARALVLFTIGCHKAEKVLGALDALLRERFPGYEATILVYLEGKFRLVDSRTPLRIAIPGTDLVRRGALLSPELERSQWADPAAVLERCAIYDAGSRAFDIPAYVEDVAEYWREVQGLARSEGWSLRRALDERWPEEPEAHAEDRRRRWLGVDPAEIDEVAEAWARVRARPDLDEPAALDALCADRLEALARAGGP